MEQKLTLFHGSEKVIEHPVFGEGKKHKDLGLGFYCAESLYKISRVLGCAMEELPGK